MKNTKVLLLMDGNHLLHRSYHKFRGFKSMDGRGSACLYGFPLVLQSMLKQFEPTKVITVFDGHSHKIRKELLPGYRDRTQTVRLDFDYKDFMAQKKGVMELMAALGISVAMDPHGEADDIIYAISMKYLKLGYKIVIVSGDKDFNQMLIHPEITIYHAGKQAKITHKTIMRHYGYRAEQTVDFLTLLGDKSDKIPGLPGCGEKTAIEFLEQWDSIERYIHPKAKEKFPRVDREKLKDIYQLHNQLINLDYMYQREYRGKKTPYKYKNPEFDWPKVLDIAAKYNIRLFTKTKDFKKLFKDLHDG